MDPQKKNGSVRMQCFHNGAITLGLLTLGILISSILLAVDSTGGFVNMIFVLLVVLTARCTTGYFWGILASFVSVICVNYIFTYPYWQLNFTIAGYPLTFLTMLSVSLIVSTLTSRVKQQEQIRMEAEREAMRANLLRAVSHDLRTPLTSIVGSTSAILENEGMLEPRQKDALLRSVRDEAQWLIRMVENLLSITRMGDSTAQLHKELEVAEELLSSVSIKFQKRFPEVALNLSASEEPLFVPMDAILIEQVLINLLENAVYHGKCTRISLSARQEEDMVVFTVVDNGSGIAEDILPHIFSPSTHTTTSSGDNRRSMGIGLSVCNSIVKAHSGSMHACNLPNAGASFRFTLPMNQSVTEDITDEDKG